MEDASSDEEQAESGAGRTITSFKQGLSVETWIAIFEMVSSAKDVVLAAPLTQRVASAQTQGTNWTYSNSPAKGKGHISSLNYWGSSVPRHSQCLD